MCVEVVWTHGENEGGQVGKENSRIRCKRREVERKAKTGWMNGVRRALNERGMSIGQGRMRVHDRKQWRAVVNACLMTQL